MSEPSLSALLATAHGAWTRSDLVAAEAALKQALAVSPFNVNALRLMAEVKRSGGDYPGALSCYDAAIAAAPNAGLIHLARAALLLSMARHGEALAGYERARALGLQHSAADYGRGAALFALGQFEPALQAFNRCAKADPASADAHYNRARCLQALDRLDEALAAYDQTLAIEPRSADALNNRAVVLHWMGRKTAALADFDAALALRADDGPIGYSKGVALLSFGGYRDGWALHELRHRTGVLPTMRNDERGEPLWRGERLSGPLRIWAEQGIGDEVLFARLVSKARVRTDHVILECSPRLAPLFVRSFEGVSVQASNPHAPPAAAQIAAGSLGFALNICADDLNQGAPYLKADPATRDAVRARYQGLARGRPITGIAWISKNPHLGAHKSSALSAWRALLSQDHFFVNLQYGDVAQEIAAVERDLGCSIYTDPAIDQLADIDAFAAQVAALDQIVSVSNTTVHLAGALGATSLVLAPPAQGLLWYWGVSGERTPWYASVRIVRRSSNESWADQVAKAAARLKF